MAFSGSFSGTDAVAEKGKRWLKRIAQLLLCSLLSLVLLGCVNRSQSVRLLDLPDVPSTGEVRPLTTGRIKGAISEVAPPAIFLDLDELMEQSAAAGQPQLNIASPTSDQILDSTSLEAKIQLRGLSIYKDKTTGLGPHLRVILDNQPAQKVYSLEDPIEFSDLAPGSHTLRVLAVKPWGESFKNETAYAQTSFHVFAKTEENTPDPNQPTLVYGEPQGTYGAEPILLDFYLNNVPLHLIAQDDPTVSDWKIRCDVNGQSFVIDQWQPMYLKGFKPGQNWVQLTLIDEQGNPIDNVFNSTVRIVNYDPTQRDTLAKMTRGELLLKDVGQTADPNYEPPAEPITAPERVAPPSQPANEEKRDRPESENTLESNEQPKSETEASSQDATQTELESDSRVKPEKLDVTTDVLDENETIELPEPLKSVEAEIEALPANELPETTDGSPEALVEPPKQISNQRFSRLRDFATKFLKKATNIEEPAQDLLIDAPAEFSNGPVQGIEEEPVQDTEQAIQQAPSALEETTEANVTEDELTPAVDVTTKEEVTKEEVTKEEVTKEEVTKEEPPALDKSVVSEDKSAGEEMTSDKLTPAIEKTTEEQVTPAIEEKLTDSGTADDAPGPYERLQRFWQQIKEPSSGPAKTTVTTDPLDTSPNSLSGESPLLVPELQSPNLDTPTQEALEPDELNPDEVNLDEVNPDEVNLDDKDKSEEEESEQNALKLDTLNSNNALPETLTAPNIPSNSQEPTLDKL